MTILVTGGTGFVGQALVPKLLEQGEQVLVLSRQPEKVSALFGPKVHGMTLHELSLSKAPIHSVINLAGAPIADKRWSKERKDILYNSRVTLTRQLIEHLRVQNGSLTTWVNASAVGYYGDQGQQAVVEDTAPNQEFTHQLCLEWEKAAFEAQTLGARVCIARLGLVLGPGGFLKRLAPPFKLGLGGRLGSGQHWMPWIHRDDVVAVLLRMLNDTTLEGAYNVVAPTPVTNRDFTRQLGQRLKRPTPFPVPAFFLKGLLGEMAQLLLTGQRALPKRLTEEVQFPFEHGELSAALRQITL